MQCNCHKRCLSLSLSSQSHWIDTKGIAWHCYSTSWAGIVYTYHCLLDRFCEHSTAWRFFVGISTLSHSASQLECHTRQSNSSTTSLCRALPMTLVTRRNDRNMILLLWKFVQVLRVYLQCTVSDWSESLHSHVHSPNKKMPTKKQF